jgi:uncharacterized membrane protein YbhN (UPF0104 family)
MKKKAFSFVLKILVSCGLLSVILDSIDFGAAIDRIVAAKPGTLTGGIVVLAFQILVIVWRWQAILTAMRVNLPFLKLLEFTYIGLFFNQALPSSVGGDAVRMYKVFKAGVLLNRSVNGVVLDRVATVLGLVLLVVIAVPFFVERVGEAESRWIIPAVSTLALGGGGGLALLMVLDKLPSRYSHLRLIRGFAALAADTRSVFLTPQHATKAMIISCFGHANVAFGVYLIAASVDLGVTWVDCMVLMPPVLLLITLPISIAGWGVREAVMVTAFGFIGVPDEGAVVLSVLFGLTAILLALPGGIIWLMSGDRQIKDLEAIPPPQKEAP